MRCSSHARRRCSSGNPTLRPSRQAGARRSVGQRVGGWGWSGKGGAGRNNVTHKCVSACVCVHACMRAWLPVGVDGDLQGGSCGHVHGRARAWNRPKDVGASPPHALLHMRLTLGVGSSSPHCCVSQQRLQRVHEALVGRASATRQRHLQAACVGVNVHAHAHDACSARSTPSAQVPQPRTHATARRCAHTHAHTGEAGTPGRPWHLGCRGQSRRRPSCRNPLRSRRSWQSSGALWRHLRRSAPARAVP